MSALTEAQQSAAPGTKVHLFSVDLTILGGPVLRFAQGTIDGVAPVFDGVTYPPEEIKATGFAWDSQGAQPTPKLAISNASSFASGLNLAYDDLVGATVTRLTTLKRFLDGQSDADPTAHFPPQIFSVNRVLRENKLVTEWELTTSLDQQGVMIPGRKMTRFCPARYRVWNGSAWDYTDVECPYVGSSYFDILGDPVSDPEDDVPSKQFLTCCDKRFPGSQVKPMYGFPAMGRVKI